YHGAIADFDKALELLPEYPDGYYARSMAKRKINDPTAAKDYKMAYDLARKNHLSTDSMSTKKKDFLQSLIKLSGDFEEMNTINGKIQNQSVDIHLLPMYRVFIGKTGFDKVEFYDSYGKKNYPQHIITLTRDPAVITDSLCRSEIGYLTRQIDSVAGLPDNYFRRAASYSGIKKYNLAFADFDTCLRKDSCFILAFFSRAIARYDLIQLINSLNDYQPEISINQNKNDLREQTRSHKMEYTYEMVIQDLDKAIHLDPGFSFAYYNRGFVYCNMGEYHKAENDFSSALKIRENFPEAYFNRGLVRILLNDIPEACEDLSHAGELGIVDAYKVMKRYCFKQ
ncbi:MAG: tetratricopeptide repeat protein, partial [Bacteroidota bacterium]|nr:tetratricopeptide repeat protein [Bacteroidota bacterium]